MVEIRPFKGMYYDPSKTDVEKVVTQPWDVITTEMRERYYAADPYNIVRIIRGKDMPGDNETENKFTRAGKYFREWLARSILVEGNTDSFYLYTQKFRLGESEFTRRGFVAAVKLEDYESGVILPHERTFPAHRADRLHLLRETKANFGQIFVLYPDPGMTIPGFLSRYDSAEPLISVSVDGVQHSICGITSREDMEFIVEEMRDKQLFIADGHHRYHTALNYRDEMLPRLSEEGRREVRYRMMTLVCMDDPSVTILPTHRAVRGVANFSEERFVRQLGDFFHVESLEHKARGLEQMLAKLRGSSPVGISFIVCLPGRKLLLLRLKDRPSTTDALPRNLHPSLRRLDVTVLHSLVMEKMLSLSSEAQQSGNHISYFRDPGEAVGKVENGDAQVTFLLNPTGVHQVREVSLAGEVMPHKSTDFYPKLLTGLIMRRLHF